MIAIYIEQIYRRLTDGQPAEESTGEREKMREKNEKLDGLQDVVTVLDFVFN